MLQGLGVDEWFERRAYVFLRAHAVVLPLISAKIVAADVGDHAHAFVVDQHGSAVSNALIAQGEDLAFQKALKRDLGF